MKAFFLFLLSLLLLIPTIGVSCVIWFYFKKKSDRKKIQLILNEVEKSAKSGGEILYFDGLKNVSMKMVTKKLKASDAIFEPDAFLGQIQHPEIGKVYMVMMKCKHGIYICMCKSEFDAQRKMFKMDLQLRSPEGLNLSKVSLN